MERLVSISDFLLARVSEDEAAAQLVLAPYGDHAAKNDAKWWPKKRFWYDMGLSSDETPLLTRMTPQRVLAECEAKRQIVGMGGSECGERDEPEGWREEYVRRFKHEPSRHYPDAYAEGCDGCTAAQAADSDRGEVLRYMAQPYVDHPDFREEWKLV